LKKEIHLNPFVFILSLRIGFYFPLYSSPVLFD